MSSLPFEVASGLKTYGRILYKIAQQVINNPDARRTCDYSDWCVEPMLEHSPAACCDDKDWTPGFS